MLHRVCIWLHRASIWLYEACTGLAYAGLPYAAGRSRVCTAPPCAPKAGDPVYPRKYSMKNCDFCKLDSKMSNYSMKNKHFWSGAAGKL